MVPSPGPCPWSRSLCLVPVPDPWPQVPAPGPPSLVLVPGSCPRACPWSQSLVPRPRSTPLSLVLVPKRDVKGGMPLRDAPSKTSLGESGDTMRSLQLKHWMGNQKQKPAPSPSRGLLAGLDPNSVRRTRTCVQPEHRTQHHFPCSDVVEHEHEHEHT